MKNKIICFIFVSLFAACGGNDSPKSVAGKFLDAMSKQDFESAKKYGTEETAKLLDMMNHEAAPATPHMYTCSLWWLEWVVYEVCGFSEQGFVDNQNNTVVCGADMPRQLFRSLRESSEFAPLLGVVVTAQP